MNTDELLLQLMIFSDPRGSPFHSFKQFFLSYMPPSQPFDISGLANAIVGQVTAGTMVCVEGQDDVYGTPVPCEGDDGGRRRRPPEMV
ncbi:hypothetical protein PsorP6_012042 [Peronosclerospora sorghi]|uniref:Uncharacterized protein n=1 Tax=Peronosclerospora sorghi TaxID=230839 RepID=A0ACC0WK17_9STRA|nr:hypothetical protein PsorP6_012042 [Peronosclerospora sorghi]